MTKVYAIKGLDCASCASKIEKKVAGLKGVTSIRVNFLTQKLTLEADENIIDELAQQAAVIVQKVERKATLLIPTT